MIWTLLKKLLDTLKIENKLLMEMVHGPYKAEWTGLCVKVRVVCREQQWSLCRAQLSVSNMHTEHPSISTWAQLLVLRVFTNFNWAMTAPCLVLLGLFWDLGYSPRLISNRMGFTIHTGWLYQLLQKHLLIYHTKLHYIDFYGPLMPLSYMDIW